MVAGKAVAHPRLAFRFGPHLTGPAPGVEWKRRAGHTARRFIYTTGMSVPSLMMLQSLRVRSQ